MQRLVFLASLATLLVGCLFKPCNWDYQPSTCTLERVELRKTQAADSVWVEGRFKVRGSFGERTVVGSVFHVFPNGTARETAEGRVLAYFERHRDLPCRWGHLTQGTCARDDIQVTFPGCRDQRGSICYELAPEELQ